MFRLNRKNAPYVGGAKKIRWGIFPLAFVSSGCYFSESRGEYDCNCPAPIHKEGSVNQATSPMSNNQTASSPEEIERFIEVLKVVAQDVCTLINDVKQGRVSSIIAINMIDAYVKKLDAVHAGLTNAAILDPMRTFFDKARATLRASLS